MAVACKKSMDHWYCIYTKPGMEETVGRRLLDLPDIEIFQPKLRRRALHRGQVREKTEHLFPCYLFSRFLPSRYGHLITYTRGVRKILSDPAGRPCVVDEEIIAQIKSRLQDGYVRLEAAAFKTGQPVRIQAGPLAGFTGVFREVKARDRVLILLNALTYQARIEISKQYLAGL
jgi:transcriptional antiterminator RfaH